MNARSTAAILVTLAATTANADVTGRVVSEAGTPIAGAALSAYALESTDARAERVTAGRPRTPLATARSAEDGAFRLAVTASVVQVESRAAGFAPQADVVENGRPTTLVQAKAAPRSGVVLGAGQPLTGATLVFTRSEGPAAATELVVTTAADGSFQAPDPDAWATELKVIHPDHAPLEASAAAAGKWPAALSFEMNAGVAIEGRLVEAASQRPVGAATVFVDGWPLARSGSDGAFRVPHAALGWRRLEARAESLVGSAPPSATALVVELKPGGTLSGAVKNAASGAPLADAIVYVAQPDSERIAIALSDARGRYRLSGLPSGQYYAYGLRPGYEPDMSSMRTFKPLDLRQPRTLEQDILMKAQERVTGRVIDESGKPVAAARVSLMPEGSPAFYADGTLGGAWWTGPDGVFSLESARGAAYPGAGTQFWAAAVKSGYAGGHSAAWTLGTPPKTPLTITLSRGIELRGRVADADGKPLEGVSVSVAEDGFFQTLSSSLLLKNQTGSGWVASDANGAFALRVAAVPHHVSLQKTGYLTTLVTGHDPRSKERLEAVLQPASAVRGQLVHSDGRPAAGWSLMVEGTEESAGNATALSDEDGRFQFESLAPGVHTVMLTKDDTGGWQSRTFEAPGSDVRLELDPTATLRGHVIDAQSRAAVTQFTIVVVKEAGGPEGSTAQKQVGDPEGAFALDDVPVGDVTVSVNAEGYRAKKVEGVTLAADAPAQDLEIALETGATLRGRVTNTDGEALAEASVSATDDENEGAPGATSDATGAYELAGLAPGPVSLEFAHEGYLSVRKTANSTDPARVDAALSKGLSVSGVVLRDGAPVAEANVMAHSSAANAQYQNVQAGADGRFTISGLVAARYSFAAMADDGGTAKLEDVDVESAGPLRLLIEKAQTTVLRGRVLGLPAGQAAAGQGVTAYGENGRDQAVVGKDGTFRLEKAPVGEVQVQAYVMTMVGNTRTTRPRTLTLTVGVEAETELEFEPGVVVSGRVTRRDAPVAGAHVSFSSDDGGGTARGRTDSDGRYELSNVALGANSVSVQGASVSYETDFAVAATATFDIDIRTGALRGRAVVAGTGEAVAGVEVSIWSVGTDQERRPSQTLTSNLRGEFQTQSLREGRYRLVTSKSGYGQQVQELDLVDGATPDVVLELSAAEGLTLQVVDGRDSRPLEAIVVVRDAARRIIANKHQGIEADGNLKIALAPGPYLLSTSANGFGTATLRVTAPGAGIRVPLTPGGTLVLESGRELAGRIQLVGADGEEYVRCWCNGIADITLKGKRTVVPNVTPGTYRVDFEERASTARPVGTVVIDEGQTATLTIP